MVEGVLVEGGYLQLECVLHDIIDGLGENSLINGKVVAAYLDPACERSEEKDDGELIQANPLLAYLAPGRFAGIGDTNGYPFPAGFSC